MKLGQMKIQRNMSATLRVLLLSTVLASMNRADAQVSVIQLPQYKLLVITSNALAAAVQPLIQHKNATGMSARVATVEDIVNRRRWAGTGVTRIFDLHPDKPALIKEEIADA